jgi:hypothetical protein
MVPPQTGSATQRPAVPKTIRPTDAELQPLVDEHSPKDGLPLTMNAARAIVDATQPERTKATIVGENDPRPDVLFDDANGARVASVEVKTAANADRAEERVLDALKKQDSPDVVALQVPSDTDISRLKGKLNAINPSKTAGKSILAVDPTGKILIELQSFR